MLKEISRQTFETFEHVLEHRHARLGIAEVGTVVNVSAGIAEVQGFTEIAANELVRFADGTTGIAANLDYGRLGAILLGDEEGFI